jgi:hypothetical protein
MMAGGSQLRSGGETWGPVSPDNVHERCPAPGPSGLAIVAAEGEQVERTRRKTWSRARSEVHVPYRPTAGIRWSRTLAVEPKGRALMIQVSAGGRAR